MDREESRLWKFFDRCRTRKCSKIIKDYQKESKIFEKEQTKKCPQKREKAFYDCSSRFYKGSKLEKLLKIYNHSLSEWENMKNNGYDRIWDCGHGKYFLTISL